MIYVSVFVSLAFGVYLSFYGLLGDGQPVWAFAGGWLIRASIAAFNVLGEYPHDH